MKSGRVLRWCTGFCAMPWHLLPGFRPGDRRDILCARTSTGGSRCLERTWSRWVIGPRLPFRLFRYGRQAASGYVRDNAFWKAIGYSRSLLVRWLSLAFALLIALLFVSQPVARHGEQLAHQRFESGHRFFSLHFCQGLSDVSLALAGAFRMALLLAHSRSIPCRSTACRKLTIARI